jgi:type IV pilus assembly protein PilY1
MSMTTQTHRWKQRLRHFAAAFAFSALTFGSAQASVNIANAPLFTTTNVEPNIMFVIDDSGSMMWETMPDDLTYRFGTGINQLLFWLFPAVHNLHGAEYYGTGNANWSRLPFFRLNDAGNVSNFAALVRSAHGNSVYYNPSTTYRPWPNADGTPMPDAPPTAAPNRPLFDGSVVGLTNHGTRNLTADFVHNRWWRDNGTTVNTNLTVFPATYFHFNGGDENLATSYDWVEIRPANEPFLGHGRENRSDCANATASPPSCTYAEEIQNFANWYSYYRNRIFAARGGIGRAFVDFDGGMRVGYGAINHSRTGTSTVDGVAGRTVISGVRDFSGTAKVDFYNELYRRSLPADGTPLRRAIEGAGQYFSRADNRGPWSSTPGVDTPGEIHLTCRQSFTILMTDGYASGGTGYQAEDASRRANNDGLTINNTTNINPSGPNFAYVPADPFQDSRTNTMADAAMYYWKRDLRPDLVNRVPTSDRNPAFWQHMVLYGIGLGVQGTINPATAFQAALNGDSLAWTNPAYDTATNCGEQAGACEARIDDLLHAAVNGRGGFFSAADPESFSDELKLVLEDIVARVDSSATSAATSSAVLQTDTLLYTAGFRSGDWSGRLDARRVNADGSLGTLAWNAEERLALKGAAARNIVTRRSDGVAVQFDFGLLSPAQQAALNHAPNGVNDGLGNARVQWLRGVEGAPFRSRSESGQPRLLGDIINSNPKFKDGVLYVGANDGMLHAFDAENGEELFAYVPSALLEAEAGGFASLSRLMDPDYAHRYFVDGTVAVEDLSYFGVPKKVLVGSLGAGGRSVFALDVTTPTTFGTGDVMWEFTDPDLGYSPGPPTIVQMSNGDLAAVFGNGYNSNNHRAFLFVVNLQTGVLIQKIDTGTGNAGNPNGLAAPAVTDWPVSGLRANRVYAGDLHGNLWRFRLGGIPSTWTDPANVTAIFEAEDAGGNPQPITAAPVIALNPADNNQVVIAFGTGSYFRTQDQDMPGAPTQSLYGIFDTISGVSSTDRASLLEQTITDLGVVTFGTETATVRRVSDNLLDPAMHGGWYLDLPVDGERVITEATFPSGPMQRRVRFSTLIPDDDPCGTGRRGFLMDVDLAGGGRTAYSVYDLNRDGSYDSDDMVGGIPISGVAWGQGERPTLLTPYDSSGDPPEFLYTGEGGFVKGLGEEGVGGRQSWQQLR